jgi:hypothetical protein
MEYKAGDNIRVKYRASHFDAKIISIEKDGYLCADDVGDTRWIPKNQVIGPATGEPYKFTGKK